MVTGAVMVLIQGQAGKIPKDRTWAKVKIMMAKVDQFLGNILYSILFFKYFFLHINQKNL